MRASRLCNAVTAGTQKAAAVAMGTDGGFVVTWHGDATGRWEISARRDRPCREQRSRAIPGIKPE